ncbi:serine hydrolase [Streptomyces sp. JV176]|uniref:serine hydrolase domain-containing protein n=1 Tax=Streptomyces sp. JV176 TaxID=858630 RepID=UPI002E789B08|nr:serine hydrolase domain-containing protein [Streptomyces sp. JV176]MEE1802577.1 serine hydrolase [Streptomyces sp. JV176]
MGTRTVRTACATTLVAAALAGTALVSPAAATTGPRGAGPGHGATQRAVEAVVGEGAPGVVAQARDRRGTWNGVAGTGDLTTGQERQARDRFRVGSITKTFVATVLLQLQGEGRIDLDDTVESRLPGVVRGNGNDGRALTVRQLLNHTSGLFNYSADRDFGDQVFSEKFLENRYNTWTARQLVDIALAHRPDFAPGTDWKYSNTNYVLAGMIVEKVTGRPYGDEIERRVLRPLGLRATSVPGTEARLPRPSGRAYSVLTVDPAPKIEDVTELNPSIAGAAGEMISTTGDLNTFYTALFKGRLLPARQLAEMRDTVSMADGKPNASGPGYGLGLMRQPLSCGKEVWGHGGGIHGSQSSALTTGDGTHALALNLNGDWAGDADQVNEAEFCG